jgi:thymidylate synthase ThyX
MHKQHANRPLEWFGWIDVLVTATQWNNFFALRISEYAQPEFDELAREILKRMNKSKPKILLSGEWHLPYITNDERKNLSLEDCQKVSVARCARLSYKPFDGNADYGAEMERYRRLMVAQPVHASPAEHQATPDIKIGMGSEKGKWWYPELHGNLHGWIQYRKTIPGEAVDG